jgi:hypothetical protein
MLAYQLHPTHIKKFDGDRVKCNNELMINIEIFLSRIVFADDKFNVPAWSAVGKKIVNNVVLRCIQR